MFSQMENLSIHLPMENVLQPRLVPNSNTETFAKMSFLTKRKFFSYYLYYKVCRWHNVSPHRSEDELCLVHNLHWANILG